jgi:L-iditol 2-dehydrogenase
MKAAVYRGRNDLRVEEVPVPAISAGEMLVRVDACGVCPTDIKKIEKGLLEPPRIFGHEITGTVAEVAGRGGPYEVGQRVVVHHHLPCRECFYCRQGAYAQCAFYKKNLTTAGFEPSGGGMAEYLRAMELVVARGTIPVPDGVTAAEAVFVEPVNTCLKAVRKARVARGETVLVVGQGPIGLLLLQIARWEGAHVIASDTMPDRLAVSRRCGAEVAFDATATDVAAEARALTEGRGADCTLLAAVGPQAFAQAVEATRPGGRVLVFSATSKGETAVVELGLLCVAEKEILTAYSSSVDLQDLAARLVFERQIDVASLVTHRFPLDRAPDAVALAARPQPGVLKVVVEMTAGRSADASA